MDPMTGVGSAMGMEHPANTLSVPPLLNERTRLRFFEAASVYAGTVGSGPEVAVALRTLNAHLDNLRFLAALSRLAILGHPHSLTRVADELDCLAADFPDGPLEDLGNDLEPHEDEPDDRVFLTIAIDIFAGAAFACKGDLARRNRFIIGAVRAIEDAIAFPVAYASEAAAYLRVATTDQSLLHAKFVIANATRRLLDGDLRCVPPPPGEIRSRLYCLALRWMASNPVNAFFDAVSGPAVCRIVHWEDPGLTRPDDARPGDRVTLLLTDGMRSGDECDMPSLDNLSVMFCPHEPAPVVRTVSGGLQVLVPARARTGPIAVVRTNADFTPVVASIEAFAGAWAVDWSLSIFGYVRMDRWAFPTAFGRPILEVLEAVPNPNPPPAPTPAPQPPAGGPGRIK